ncbi:MAG: hypothetical protein PHW41_01665 [Eubacteriales bacterium]|nr:hypothetical protein [Eubacteriales bacterium]
MQLSELVRRIRRGEKEAVKELVAAYGSAVYQRAFERTNDKELAREAARQTFGQFVAIVQQQPEEDGWTLWFGDLIEKNISTYAQISTDMRTIESELDHEIVDSAPVVAPVAARPAVSEPEPLNWRTPEPEPVPPRKAEQEPLIWREQQEQLSPRTPEKPKRSERARKQDERKQEARVHKDNVRDEIFDEPYRNKQKNGLSHGVSIVLLILVSLVLLWVVAGVAMTMQWIPTYDLGFNWFNQHVFKLF